MPKNRMEMDVASYDAGVLSLPERLRTYAMLNAGVEMTLNEEQAMLLADDIERGIATRGIDFAALRGILQSFVEQTDHPEIQEAVDLLGEIFGHGEEIRNRIPDPRSGS